MTWLDYCFYFKLLVFVEQNDKTKQRHNVKNTLCPLYYLLHFFLKKSNNELSSIAFNLCVSLAD